MNANTEAPMAIIPASRVARRPMRSETPPATKSMITNASGYAANTVVVMVGVRCQVEA